MTGGTPTTAPKTPDTSSKTPGTDKPTQASEQTRKDQQGKKISVAAAIGVSVARNQGRAEIGQGLNINAGTGELKLDAQSDTNYTTKSSGEAVSAMCSSTSLSSSSPARSLRRNTSRVDACASAPTRGRASLVP